MVTQYTSASKDWWQKHSDEIKTWDWDSFCRVWAAAVDSVTPARTVGPQLRFIKDVEVYGVIHKAGEIHILDSYDKLTDTEVLWCIGHGMLFPLKIGDEVEVL